MPKTIITTIENRTVFLNLLKDNPGIIILKFGASWCKPCKLIETPVYNFLVLLRIMLFVEILMWMIVLTCSLILKQKKWFLGFQHYCAIKRKYYIYTRRFCFWF